MKYLIAAFIVIIAVCIATSCGKRCVDAQYNFNMQEVFYPEKDSILVGETLFMESVHSTIFNDTLINKSIDFSGSNIGSSLRLLRFPDNSSTVVGGMNDFEIHILEGNAPGNDNIPTENKGVFFTERNGNYRLKISLIAKQKGIYAISLGDAIGIVEKRNSCEKANISIKNVNLNKNLYYYQNFFNGLPINDYSKTHVYCFKVY